MNKRIPPPAKRIPAPAPMVRSVLIDAWHRMTKEQLIEELTTYLDRALAEMPDLSK